MEKGELGDMVEFGICESLQVRYVYSRRLLLFLAESLTAIRRS